MRKGAAPALDAPMVLLYPVIEILALANANWFLGSSRPVAQAVFSTTGDNCLVICLASIDDDAIRAAMARKCLSKDALFSRQVTVLAEEELKDAAAVG